MKYYTIIVETPTTTKSMATATESSAHKIANQFRDYFMSGKGNCEYCYITIRSPLFRTIRRIYLHQN